MRAPTLDEVKKLAELGNVIPVFKTVMADLLTPVSAFLRAAAGRDHPFLLESVEGGEKIARYSFIGCDPFLVIRSKGEMVELNYKGARPPKTETVRGSPIAVLRSVASSFRPVAVAGLPRFSGGGVGYFAYDLVRLFEQLPEKARDDLGLPDIEIAFYSTLLAFDHIKHQIFIISNIFVEENEKCLEEKYTLALDEISAAEARLGLAPEEHLAFYPSDNGGPVEIWPNVTRERYCRMVLEAQERIKAGDIFQVVLSQRLECEVKYPPFHIYRALRAINPSPYMFFLDFGDLTAAGASPEMLVRVVGRDLEYRPIAGTRRRGRDEREDAELEAELRGDEKERAEHIMLVDLGRNDLGRVAEFGSVRVRELMSVERYSHVMHLVSSLEARLRRGLDRFDAFVSCFPAGTVTGAPKVKAMEIIEELEPTRRGIYAGSIAYLDFSGNLDSCIALRTILFKGGMAYIQAGGGVVADSTPEGEYQESMNKALAMVRAVEMAEKGFKL